MLKIIVALWLVTAQLLMPVAAIAQTVETRIEVAFRGETTEDGLIEVDLIYSDAMFSGSAYQYDHRLARLSLGLATSAFNTRASDAHWGEDGADSSETFGRDAQVRAALESIGFESIQAVNYEVNLYDTAEKVAFTLATKFIEREGEPIAVIAVIIRGGSYGGEWAGNFRIGRSGEHHAGFDAAASGVLRALTT